MDIISFQGKDIIVTGKTDIDSKLGNVCENCLFER